jgi:hypothetical protein
LFLVCWHSKKLESLLSNGDNFDTKKSAGEAESLRQFKNCINKKRQLFIMKEKFNLQIDPCFEMLKLLGLNITQLKGRQQFYREKEFAIEIVMIIEEYVIRDIIPELGNDKSAFNFDDIWFLEKYLGYELKIREKIENLEWEKYLEKKKGDKLEKEIENPWYYGKYSQDTHDKLRLLVRENGKKLIEIQKKITELDKELDAFFGIVQKKQDKVLKVLSAPKKYYDKWNYSWTKHYFLIKLIRKEKKKALERAKEVWEKPEELKKARKKLFKDLEEKALILERNTEQEKEKREIANNILKRDYKAEFSDEEREKLVNSPINLLIFEVASRENRINYLRNVRDEIEIDFAKMLVIGLIVAFLVGITIGSICMFFFQKKKKFTQVNHGRSFTRH